jgi:hypothetical protein
MHPTASEKKKDLIFLIHTLLELFFIERRNIFAHKSLFFSSKGEVERLLKEYRQNQELVRQIGGHYYQIIYPTQLRHHEKMGISTREVGGSKVWSTLEKRNIMNSNTVCHSPFFSSAFIFHPSIHSHGGAFFASLTPFSLLYTLVTMSN